MNPPENDPIFTGLMLIFVIVAFFVASRPERSIRILSYGRRGVGDVNPLVLRTTRTIAAIFAVIGAAQLLFLAAEFLSG